MKLLATLLLFALTTFAAGVPGKWIINAPRQDGTPVKVTLTIRVVGDGYSGTIKTADGDEVTLTNVKVKDSELTFRVITDDAKYDVTATVDGDSIKGRFIVNENPGGTFTGTRDTGSNP